MIGPTIAGVVCGKKFCSYCKRWRHVIDFNVRTWRGEIGEELWVQTLSSECKTCNTVKYRQRRGFQARKRVPHPSTPAGREHRNAKNRASAARRRQDPEYRKREREYQRIWRSKRAAAEGREFKPRPRAENRVEFESTWNWNPRYDATPFLLWWDSLNGSRSQAAAEIVDLVRICRRNNSIRLQTLDRICMEIGRLEMVPILLDEMEEVAPRRVRS
jgi:hypothetical protein